MQEEIAYGRGMEAYVYGFPPVIMDVTSGVITAVPKSGEDCHRRTVACGAFSQYRENFYVHNPIERYALSPRPLRRRT